MNRIFMQSRMLDRTAWISMTAAIALTFSAGASSASAMVMSKNPKNQFSGLNDYDDFKPGSELEGVDTDPTDINPLEVRGHSDVPDLPDSGEGENNLGLFMPPANLPGGPEWNFDVPVGEFGAFDLVPDLNSGSVISPSSSPVPAPSGLLALGVAAVATGARRRR